MKTIGTTPEGNYIVQMSKEEHISFARLEAAVMGKDYRPFEYSPFMQGTELSPVFGALNDVFELKISINKIREYVDNLYSVFGGK